MEQMAMAGGSCIRLRCSVKPMASLGLVVSLTVTATMRPLHDSAIISEICGLDSVYCSLAAVELVVWSNQLIALAVNAVDKFGNVVISSHSLRN